MTAMLSELMGRLARLTGARTGARKSAPDGLLDAAAGAAARGEAGRARSICEEIVARFPRHAAGRRLLGMLHAEAGDAHGALAHLAQAAALAPEWPEAHLALGNVQQLLRDAGAAEASYRRALALAPAAAGAHYNLALLMRRAGRKDEALQAFRRAHELEPAHSQMTWDLVQALLDGAQPEEAWSAVQRTLALAGESAAGSKAAGVVHLYRHEPAEALERFLQATALAPEDPEGWLNAGLALRELGRFDDALVSCERALALRPAHAAARWHHSLLRLLKGEFGRAWTDYEARLLSETWPRQGFPQRRWHGEELAGKTLLVHAEQGLGDEIMFASCLPEIIARAGRCIIDCHPKLVAIFERSFPTAAVHGGYQTDDLRWLEAYPEIDYQIPIGSLALHTRASAGDFPRHQGYLRADPRKVASWHERLANLGTGLKIGLSWRGGTHASRSSLRSVELAALLPVLNLERVAFVDLQYTDTTAERAELQRACGVRLAHWPDALADYDETAALVCALDLTLSVCTALVHLAGALGKPAWVMTPYSPEWRYGSTGEAMAWYPSVKLVRQRRYGEWQPVIATVAADLGRLAARQPGDAS